MANSTFSKNFKPSDTEINQIISKTNNLESHEIENIEPKKVQDLNLNNENNHFKYDNLCLGIDFGTTNSCLTVWYKNKALNISDLDNSQVIPTVIEITPNKKVIGKEAYLRKDIFEKTNTNENNKNTFLVYEIKKLLGKKYSELSESQINMLAYTLIPDDSDNIRIYDSNTEKYYYPEEIATHLFMSFKTRAELFLSNKFNCEVTISNAVISVPAYFNKNQREIIKSCSQNAGFNVLRLINEPTAAALCYGLGKNLNNSNKNIIVYDLGGGTLDVCLLFISDGVYEVLGSCGNNNLGGSDFDNKIMEYVIGEFINQNNIDENYFIENIEENTLQKLKYLAEHTKIALTDNLNTKLKINNFFNGKDLSVSISREKFNEICENLIRLAVKPLHDILTMCEIEKEKIDEIIMVGGMTRIPIIRYSVERFFNKDVNCSIDPDTVVSIGASIQGHMLTSSSNIEDKLLLVDRTPLSIGLETSGGIMDFLVPRGTIIPVKKTRKYTTDTDNTEWIPIKIYEGERKLTKDNFLIGDFILSGIEKEKRGIPEIQITFEIDTDGIVKIKAEDLKNPLNKKIVQVSGNKQNLSQEELDKIVENAKKMDLVDRLDKMQKESYLSLIDSSKRILENINSPEVKLDQNIKSDISANVKEILEWLLTQNYSDITQDKYRELLNDYKANYSIYLIQNNVPIINLESANDEDNKGIEIYEEENKKYDEQIKYFRSLIDEYDTIGKQMKMYSFMDSGSHEKNEIKKNLLDKLEILHNELYNYANDTIIKLFIENNLTDEIVNTYCIKLNEYDIQFKKIFDELDKEYNIVSKLMNKIKEKENTYLDKLSTIQNEDSPEFKEINKKLDLIIDFDSYIYKINNGYIQYESSKIIKILNELQEL
jgi:molecular chaperone DnaK (HSP70)